MTDAEQKMPSVPLDENGVGEKAIARRWSELSEEAVIEQEPTRARNLLYGVLAILILLVIWSAVASIDTVTRGPGKVIPSSQVQIIGSQDGGIVQDILVSEGEFVTEGQILLRLDRTRSEASLGENQAEVRGLEIRARRLDALVSGRDFVPDEAMLRFAPQVVAEEMELFETSNAELAAQELIAQRQKRQREEELEELLAKRDQLITETTLARNELEVTRIAALSQAGEGLTDRVNQTEVIAPVTGTVKQLHYNTVGGVVLPGRDIVELVPADDTLLLEVRIKPQDIAFLAPGQAANVKFTAYDFVVYGGMEGFIEQIGADTLLDSDDEPYYEVTVRTANVDFGPDKPIIPGMTVDVDILTGRKTVLSYLMKPILRAQELALSER
ncbi:MAG: HlyD family efflux transporter periplasmic adaptor subunit [Halieaceae bacterium]